MKKLALLAVFFLVYEQTNMGIVPCGQYSNQQWSAVSQAPKEQVYVQTACIEKRVKEISRQKFKTRALAEKGKAMPEANGFAYRIEEVKK